MDFSRRCPRFHHANSRPTLSRLQRARRKNLYLSLEYTTFCLKKQAKKTISMKAQNFVTFPVHSRFKFGADVPLFPNGDIAHARRSDAPARMGVSLIEKQRLFPDGKRQKASSLRRTVQRQLDMKQLAAIRCIRRGKQRRAQRMFCPTVILEKSVYCWNRYPSLRFCGGRSMCFSLSGRSMPAMHLSVLLLPQPDSGYS